MPDSVEVAENTNPFSAASFNDTDNDEVADFTDADSDGDGISDSVEGIADIDGDSLPNFLDATTTNLIAEA